MRNRARPAPEWPARAIEGDGTDYSEARRSPEMSRVRRLLLGYLFPALLLHGEFGDGWVNWEWGCSGPPIAPRTTSGVAPGRRVPSMPACPFRPVRGAPFPQRRPQWLLLLPCSFWKDANLAQIFFISHIRSCTAEGKLFIHSEGLTSCKLSQNRRLCCSLSTGVRAQQGLSVRSRPLRDCKEKAVVVYREDTSRGCLSAV